MFSKLGRRELEHLGESPIVASSVVGDGVCQTKFSCSLTERKFSGQLSDFILKRGQ